MGKIRKKLNSLSRTSYNRRLKERIGDFNNTTNQNVLPEPFNFNMGFADIPEEEVDIHNITDASQLPDIQNNSQIQSECVHSNSNIPDPVRDNTNFLNDSYEIIVESDSDSDTSFIEEDDNEILRKKLAVWAKEENMTLSAITSLLTILRCHGHPTLPKVGQTLLHTPTTKHAIVQVDPGYYAHIGLEKNLLRLLANNKNKIKNSVLSIDINIDGVPITKSTKKSFWPILGRCSELSKEPFPIGIYYGLQKPKSCNTYLTPFAEEIKKINLEGIRYSEKIYFVTINCFICDAPAQAFVKGIIGHNGYSGCGKCTQEGEFDDRLYFPETEFVKRTDQSFKDRVDESHHKNSCTVLEDLGIGMVTQFPGDYLHLICLGVTKKLLLIWTKGPLNNRLPAFKQQQISERLINARLTQPNEFQRRIRGLDELAFWKGTELRTFLSYAGPVVLKGVLNMSEYKNFLALHTAMRICNNKKLHYKLEIARELFIYFVKSFRELYGEKYMSYNIHNLLHIVDDVLRYGVLEDFSAYPFESSLGKLKKKVRHGNKMLEQVINRVLEGWDIQLEAPHIQSPILKKMTFKDENETRYLYIQTKNFLLKFDQKNCYFMNDSSDILKLEYIKKINDNIIIVGKKFLKKFNLYTTPLDSSFLGIFTIDEKSLSSEIFEYNIENIKCKVFVVKQEQILTAFPMHH